MDIASWSVSSEQASGVFSLETASSFYINDGYSNETNSGDSFPDIHIPPNQFANTSLEISPLEDKPLRPSSPSYNNYCWISSLHQIDPTLLPPTFHMDVNANCNSNHDYLSVANSVNSFELLLNVRYTDEDASRLGFMPSQEDIDGCNTQESSPRHTGGSPPFQPEVTGEAQYYCTRKNCRRKQPFTRKADLKRHELIHTGVKPYNCQFEGCVRTGENAFSRRDKLREHQKKAHGFLWGEYAAFFRPQ